MKVPGLVTLLIGVINLGLALLLAGPMQWGLYGIAAAGAITMTLKHALFTPLYAAHVLGKPAFTFLREMTPILIVTVTAILLGHAMTWVWEIAGWGDLIVSGLGLSVVYCAGVYGLLLTPAERQMLRSISKRGAS
jgi:membrane protein EpsK